MLPFDEIYARAARRKGGAEVLESLLGDAPDNDALRSLKADRVLAEMTRCMFRAGFVWRVIDHKWPGFEQAFLQFHPHRLAFEPDEFWEALASDKRIVRNGPKIMAVRHNASFVLDVAQAHDGFGAFLADWPSTNLIGLWDYLAKHGKRLGGMTGRYFLRFVGKDGFLPSRDVVLALRDAGLDIAPAPTSKRDLIAIQNQFNAWAQQTSMSFCHLSRVLAMSIGENYGVETLRERGGLSERD